MNEIWKDIPGYAGLYQISNLGRIKSFRRSTKFHKVEEYILKPSVANNGYCQVTLYDNGKRKKFLVHRLVATAFIDNPYNLPQINHKDENRLNNSAENLEWCTPLYNNCYGTAKLRAVDKMSKPVAQYTTDGKLIAVYRSARIAAELLGFTQRHIQHCCNNGGIGFGYYWEYSSFVFPSL